MDVLLGGCPRGNNALRIRDRDRHTDGGFDNSAQGSCRWCMHIGGFGLELELE